MSLDTNALFLQIDSVYNANSLGLMARDAIGEGVVGASDFAVTQRGAGANMSVDVAAGAAWVKGDEDDTQPTYRVRSTAAVNVAISAANATNPRIDLVGVEVRDSVFAGASDDCRFLVVAGTPASSPSAPATPDNFLLLARVYVAAQVTEIVNGDITDMRTRAGIDSAFVVDGSVTAAKLADALRPSEGAGAGTEALRALGTAAGEAYPGDTAAAYLTALFAIPRVIFKAGGTSVPSSGSPVEPSIMSLAAIGVPSVSGWKPQLRWRIRGTVTASGATTVTCEFREAGVAKATLNWSGGGTDVNASSSWADASPTDTYYPSPTFVSNRVGGDGFTTVLVRGANIELRYVPA